MPALRAQCIFVPLTNSFQSFSTWSDGHRLVGGGGDQVGFPQMYVTAMVNGIATSVFCHCPFVDALEGHGRRSSLECCSNKGAG